MKVVDSILVAALISISVPLSAEQAPPMPKTTEIIGCGEDAILVPAAGNCSYGLRRNDRGEPLLGSPMKDIAHSSCTEESKKGKGFVELKCAYKCACNYKISLNIECAGVIFEDGVRRPPNEKMNVRANKTSANCSSVPTREDDETFAGNGIVYGTTDYPSSTCEGAPKLDSICNSLLTNQVEQDCKDLCIKGDGLEGKIPNDPCCKVNARHQPEEPKPNPMPDIPEMPREQDPATGPVPPLEGPGNADPVQIAQPIPIMAP